MKQFILLTTLILGTWASGLAQAPERGESLHLKDRVFRSEHHLSGSAHILLDQGSYLEAGAKVTIQACKSVKLGEGFKAGRGTELAITTEDDCQEEVYKQAEAAPSRDALSIGPNPARDCLTIALELNQEVAVSIDLYDLQGRKVMQIMEEQVYPEGLSQVSVDISALQSGHYLYRAVLGGDLKSGQLVKLD